MSGKEKLKWLEWKKEDFVITDIKKDAWKSYLVKFPNMEWGTCIISKNDNTLTIQRFVSKEICRKYCTAPVSIDFGITI